MLPLHSNMEEYELWNLINFSHKSVSDTRYMLYICMHLSLNAHWCLMHFVCFMFSCVRLSHGLCALSHMHSLEGTVLITMHLYYSIYKRGSQRQTSSWLSPWSGSQSCHNREKVVFTLICLFILQAL